MTAATAELCDHRWGGALRAYCPSWRGVRGHRCAEPAGHDDPPVHRCRCGATTTREDT